MATNEQGRRVPATERVLEFILGEMDAGRLGPGKRVNAARISATLELSAAPVREALSSLAGRGVLELRPDRGAVVRELTPREVMQLWELIAPIGAVGLGLAAARISAGADPSPLIAAFDQLVRQSRSGSPLELVLSLNEWHFVANQIGGNPFVTVALERLGVSYWDRYLVGLIDVRANADGYRDNYRRMHEAVLAGDGPSAAAALHFHAQWSIRLIEQAAEAPARRRTRRTTPSS